MTVKVRPWALIMCLLFLLGFSSEGCLTQEKFDSTKWKNWVETEKDWSLRWDMMNSLKREHELVGMIKSDVLELLGEPDSKSVSEFSYYLGMAGRGIDIGTLIISFNKNGVVSEYKVLRT